MDDYIIRINMNGWTKQFQKKINLLSIVSFGLYVFKNLWANECVLTVLQ